MSYRYKLWKTILEDVVPIPLSENLINDLYWRTTTAYGLGQTFWIQMGPEPIDLTKLFEQYRILVSLNEGPDHGEETN